MPETPPVKLEISRYGSCPVCPLCNHAARDKLTEIYFEREKNIAETSEWFDDKFKRDFPESEFEKHFKEHIDPFVTEEMFMQKVEMEELRHKSLSSTKENNIRFNVLKQMIWEQLKDVYINRPKKIKSSADRTEQQKTTKQIVDLAKTYREQWQLEMNFLGMGKTEEEMKNTMKNYVAGMMKQAAGSISEFPDAKKKLEAFWDRQGKGEEITEDVVVEEEDNGI